MQGESKLGRVATISSKVCIHLEIDTYISTLERNRLWLWRANSGKMAFIIYYSKLMILHEGG
jgi:hypothetical protein